MKQLLVGALGTAIVMTVALMILPTPCESGIETVEMNEETQSVTVLFSGGLSSGLYRYIDKEMGVVCWMNRPGGSGGISCLPISETRLEQ